MPVFNKYRITSNMEYKGNITSSISTPVTLLWIEIFNSILGSQIPTDAIVHGA